MRKLLPSTLPHSMDQGVDEFITRGLNIVAWVLVFLLAPETKEYTLEELDSICEFPTLDACCQSGVLICNSWRPYATIHLPQGGIPVQSRQVLGLPPRHCLQRPLRRQTARLRSVTVANVACPSSSTATLRSNSCLRRNRMSSENRSPEILSMIAF